MRRIIEKITTDEKNRCWKTIIEINARPFTGFSKAVVDRVAHFRNLTLKLTFASVCYSLPAIYAISETTRFMQASMQNRTGDYSVLDNAEALRKWTLSIENLASWRKHRLENGRRLEKVRADEWDSSEWRSTWHNKVRDRIHAPRSAKPFNGYFAKTRGAEVGILR